MKEVAGRGGKLHYLEGMRALMAINVLLCHFVCVYYPQMYFANFAAERGGFLAYFASTPLNVLINGNVAVKFFFALTGFLVGMSVFTKKPDVAEVEKKSVMRYFRLLPVIAITTVFTYITMVLGAQNHLAITNPNANVGFLADYCNFTPTIASMLKAALFEPMLFNKYLYVGPFWTVYYEFWGYIMVLVAAHVLRKAKLRRLWYAAIAFFIMVMLKDVNFTTFFMGLFVADLAFNVEPSLLGNIIDKIINNKVFLIIAFVVGTYFACCPIYQTKWYAIWFKIPLVSPDLLRAIGISLCLFVMTKSGLMQRVLSVKPLVKLGNISFETYAVHWPLMLTLEAGLFIALSGVMAYDLAAILAFAITVPVIYLASFLLNMAVKRINRLFDKLLAKKEA